MNKFRKLSEVNPKLVKQIKEFENRLIIEVSNLDKVNTMEFGNGLIFGNVSFIFSTFKKTTLVTILSPLQEAKSVKAFCLEQTVQWAHPVHSPLFQPYLFSYFRLTWALRSVLALTEYK